MRSFSTAPAVHGLTKDAAVIELDGRLEHIELASGQRTALINGVSPADQIAVSPDLSRAVRRELHGLRIYALDGSEHLFSIDEGEVTFFWAGATRLVFHTRAKLEMIDTSGERVALFPPREI